MLHTIAFLLPDDVQRLIDEEAHDINVAMLANRKTYSQLCINLMTGMEYVVVMVTYYQSTCMWMCQFSGVVLSVYMSTVHIFLTE